MDKLKLVKSSFELKESDLYYVVNETYEIQAEIHAYKFIKKIKSIKLCTKTISYLEVEKIFIESDLNF